MEPDPSLHTHFTASAPVSRVQSEEDGSAPSAEGNQPQLGQDDEGPSPQLPRKGYGREIPLPSNLPANSRVGMSPYMYYPFPSPIRRFPSGRPLPLVTGLGRPMPTQEEKHAYGSSKSEWNKRSAQERQRSGAGGFPQTFPAPLTADAAAPSNVQYVLVTPEMLKKRLPQLDLRHSPDTDATIRTLSDIETDGPKPKAKETSHEVPGGSAPPAESVNQGPESREEESVEEAEPDFPNPWAKIRYRCREPFAEFLGTMFLILFGNGVNNQYFLTADTGVTPSQYGTYLSVSWGWGLGVCMGVYVAGGVSGGHVNPAVTLGLACFRGFPWKKVPIYWFAQILGAFAGACIIFGLYQNAINIFEGGQDIRTIQGGTGTAQLFATYPQTYLSNASAFFQEFTDTAVLLVIVLAIGDRNNTPPPDGLNAIVLLFVVLGIGACLGTQTAYAINPARDLGPRLMTYCMGYGTEVWNYRNQYWLWTPVIATLAGGVFGGFLYDSLIYTGRDSPLNRKWEGRIWGRKKKEQQLSAKEKLPAGLNSTSHREQNV